MSWKFNPPPGWPPQPEGWQPPPGWAPDPSWPTPPPGWQFWVPAANQAAPTSPAGSASPAGTLSAGSEPSVHEAPTAQVPATGPAHPTPPYVGQSAPHGGPTGPYPPAAPSAGGSSGGGRWWVFGVLAVVVVLVACLAGSGIAILTNRDTAVSPTPAPSPTGEPSPGQPDNGNQPSAGGLQPGEERSGEGPAIVTLSPTPGAYHTVTVTFVGDGLFAARMIDDDGEYVASVGSGLHEFTTTRLVELGNWGVATAVDISDANGQWTVSLQDLDESPMWPDQHEGNGPTVLRVDPTAAAAEPLLIGTHDGDSNFIVWAYSDPDSIDQLLFNEIGEHSGEASTGLAPDALVLSIDADGAWSLEVDD